MVVNLIAALWGLAEATLFFIVPDVWLSLAGRRHLGSGLRACLFALIGALAGGAIVYSWGAHDTSSAIALIENLPAIDPAMVVRVREELATHGVKAIFFGPLTGTPYKLYAAQAATAGIGFIVFVLMSIPARGLRFVLITLAVHYGLKKVVPAKVARHPAALILGCWVLFYLYYFAVMPG